MASEKIMATFSEVSRVLTYQRYSCGSLYDLYLQESNLQVEKRGNFVVISCVEGNNVVSWSLNVRTLLRARQAHCTYQECSTDCE